MLEYITKFYCDKCKLFVHRDQVEFFSTDFGKAEAYHIKMQYDGFKVKKFTCGPMYPVK